MVFIAVEYVMCQGTLDASWGPSPNLFVGVCFAGLTVFESSVAARNLARYLPSVMCIIGAALIAVAYLLTPPNSGHLWNWTYVPLFILIVLEVSLLWSLVPKESDGGSDRLGLKAKYAFVLLFLLTLLGGSNSMYGQMVSFFLMTIPVILAWEGVIDLTEREEWRAPAAFRPLVRIMAATAVFIIASFIGYILGNWYWVT